MFRGRLKLLVILGAAGILLTLLFGTRFLLERTWQSHLNNASASVERNARVAANIVNRQLLQVDGALASLSTLFAPWSTSSGGLTPELATIILRGLNFQTFAFRELLLVDNDGTIWAAARSRPGRRSPALSFDPHEKFAASRLLGPIRNPVTGDWTVYLGRPVDVPGVGRLTAFAEIPVSAITTPLGPVADAPGARMTLMRPDGRPIAMLPHDEIAMSRSAEGSPSAQSDPRSDPATDDVYRSLTVSRPTLYPDIQIALTLDPVEALADWYRDRERLLIVVTCAAGLALALAATLVFGLLRQDELEREREKSQSLLEDAIEAMADGFVMWDKDDRLFTCNSRYVELYRESAPFLKKGNSFEDIIRWGFEAGQYPQAGKDVEKFVEGVLAWHRDGEGAYERLLPDGRWLLIMERPTKSGGIVGIRTDITALKKAQADLAAATERVRETMNELQMQNAALLERDKALQTQNMLFNAALNNMSHGLLMADAAERVIVTNRRLAHLLQLPADAALQGRPLRDMFATNGPEQSAELGGIVERQIVMAEARSGGTFVADAPGGRSLAITQQPMEDGGFVAIYEDVTEQQQAEQRIRFLALHDSLTRLPNRIHFRQSLDKLLPMLGNPDDELALLCLDLDKFKDVNDTLGHPMGDALLEQVGQRLRSCLRETDVVARLGGDEFAIAFIGQDAKSAAGQLAERIIRKLSSPYELFGQAVDIGVSVGVAIAAAGHHNGADTLMKKADMALYAAKADGRGNWKFFEPAMEEKLRLRLELESDLKVATQRDQFRVAYQPLVNLADRRISGFEALLRWEHPTRGLVPPMEFIGLAEESRIIGEIGAWILNQACSDLARMPDPVKLAVNLSPVQLRSPTLVGTVRDALSQTGFAPSRLELEITETALLEDSEQVISCLYALKEIGIRIVLDDFGTGFSSLNYLRRFPFDKIKIDKVFVREATVRQDCSAIIQSVVSLADQLGMTTTAEGVETADQLDLVRTLGCTEGQGWLFGRPQPILHALAALGDGLPRSSSQTARLAG